MVTALAASRLLLESDYRARSLLVGLQGCWPLNEASGASRLDLSGNGYTLSDTNSVATVAGPSAKVPSAGRFVRASLKSLTIADNAAFSGGTGKTFFMAAAVNLISKPAGGFPGVFGKSTTAGHREYYLAYNSDGDAFVCGVSSDGTNFDGGHTLSNFGALALSTWALVGFGFDLAAGLVITRVNLMKDTSVFAGPVFDSDAAFTVGLATTNQNFDGDIAQPVFWNRIPTDAEWAYYYNGGRLRALVHGKGFV